MKEVLFPGDFVTASKYTNFINLFGGPSSGSVVGTLPKGSLGTVIAAARNSNGGIALVLYDQVLGWAHATWLERVGET